MVRIKNRYLLLNILYPSVTPSTSKSPSHTSAIAFKSPTPDYIDAGRFVGHLKTHITFLFGDYGLGSSLSSLKVIYFSAATSTVILRVPRNHHQLVWAALTHVTELPPNRRGASGTPCVIQVVRVSGTIRKAEEELIRRTKQEIVRAKSVQDGQQRQWLPEPSREGVANQVDPTTAQPNISIQSIEDSSGDEEDESE